MTKIEWSDRTWNVVSGCTKIADGCRFCYSETMTKRLKAMGQEKYKEGFDKVVKLPELDGQIWNQMPEVTM